MSHRKGSTLQTLQPWKVIPLFIENEDKRQKWALLPGYSRYNQRENGSIEQQQPLDYATCQYIRDMLRSTIPGDVIFLSIIGAMALLQQEKSDDLMGTQFNEMYVSFDDSLISSRALRQSWQAVHTRISREHWKKLVFLVCRSMHVVHQEHPLVSYAVHVVPHLSATELNTVVRIMKLDTTYQSPLAVQKQLRDHIMVDPGPSRRYLVLARPIRGGSTPSIDQTLSYANVAYPHSCMPTAHLELLPSGTISVTALFDCDSDDVTLCYVPCRDDVEQRDEALQQRFASSCTCLRCRYEISESNANPASLNLSMSEASKLANFYLSQGGEGRDTAKTLYQYALQLENATANSRSLAMDVYHALGAIELSYGKFLAAQRIWSQAVLRGDEAWSEHTGISLQVEKINAYAYPMIRRPLNDIDQSAKLLPHNVDAKLLVSSPIPGVFIVPVVDKISCDQIIRWAEELGTWTKHRHYEVPTYDVPVHTIPPLLHWFQHQFMNHRMQNVLEECFEKSGRCFHVHDAFCVRYEAGLPSNHLPIHTDESTHSFVLTLNKGFDGGGTYFFARNLTIHPEVGSVLCFRGDEMAHGGEALTRGVRYILTAFLYYDEDLPESNDASCGSKRGPSRPTMESYKAKQSKSEFSFKFALDESKHAAT
jgi:hypothetical protein